MTQLRLALGKECSKCGDWKLYEDFHRQKRSKDGRNSWCRNCFRLNYQRNLEHNRDQRRAYREANSESIETQRRERRQTLKALGISVESKRTREQKEAKRIRAAQWKKDNPERVRQLSLMGAHRRRERKLSNGGTGSITWEQWQELLEEQGGKCLRCGSEKHLSMDHVVPLSKGGIHDVSNIQVLCLPCNVEKRANIADYR